MVTVYGYFSFLGKINKLDLQDLLNIMRYPGWCYECYIKRYTVPIQPSWCRQYSAYRPHKASVHWCSPYASVPQPGRVLHLHGRSRKCAAPE
jgi:hypothetical protein